MKLQLGMTAALTVVLLGTSGVAASVPGHAAGSSAAREAPAGSPLAAQVLAAPEPVLATDNRQHLVYEISLINVTPLPVRVDKVSVINAANRSVVASYSGPTAIRAIMTTVAAPHDPVDELPPSGAGMLWLDVSLSRGARIPARLTHRIESTIMTPAGPVQAATNGAATRVVRRRPVVLTPPLSGPGYADANGCCGESNHTRAVQTIDGRRFLAQRFAIDWVRIDRRGRDYIGDWRKNKNWLIFGDRIYAAAPGVVVETINNLPENTPPHPAAHLTLRTAPGNNVIEDIGGGLFALYAHMQPRSVAVHVGEHIRRGQFLGLAGNTGSSTAPHLHFQVMSAPSALMANGVPYVFRKFQLTAEILNIPEFSRDVHPLPARLGPALPPRTRRDELPLVADVTTFSIKK
jgi:Peptidase family M23